MASVTLWRNLAKFSTLKHTFRLFAPGAAQIHLDSVCHSKHWNPKWRKLRRLKVVKVDLPDFSEKSKMKDKTLSPDEVRAEMKELGLPPYRPWQEKTITIGCTDGIFEPYVPPEGDGKISPITATGAKQKFVFLEKKGKSMMAVRKIRSYDEDFDPRDFAEKAQDIYRKVHQALTEKDEDVLHELVTEKAFPELMHNVKYTSLRWQFLKSLEPPRVAHVRCTDVISKDNMFAQVTVRCHTQQVLAVYDRFGRLMYGSEVVAKDVLEYVVFEKHLANEYGVWRIHGKVIPDWMPAKEAIWKTFVKQNTETVTKDIAVS